ncbi:MAG: hypothetical protein ACKVWR_03435 [Acidimicrobiales bacterium]
MGSLLAHTEDIAARFVTVFETHLAPEDWQEGLDSARPASRRPPSPGSRPPSEVLLAALDASVARLGRERLGQLIER